MKTIRSPMAMSENHIWEYNHFGKENMRLLIMLYSIFCFCDEDFLVS